MILYKDAKFAPFNQSCPGRAIKLEFCTTTLIFPELNETGPIPDVSHRARCAGTAAQCRMKEGESNVS
jgi:hypothetical protein